MEKTENTAKEDVVPKKGDVAKKPKKKKDPKEKLFKPDHKPFVLASSPHDFRDASVPKIMWSVVAALAPTTVMAVYYFGWPAVWLILACTGSALLTEILINAVKGQKLTVMDGSAAITGLLLALTLPPTLSIYSAILGSVFAIAIGKQVFGGLGYNIFNPALIGRAFLQASFPVAMTTWTLPFADFDGVSAATPLGNFKFEKVSTSLEPLLTGSIGGSLGETCAVAILAGGLFLLVKKYADWRIPLSFLGTVFVVGGIFWLFDSTNYPDPVFQLFSGGLMLGAFFMATDMVTSPITPKGAWIFGIGAGILLVIIRFFGGLPEGVMYSILLMNSLTPLINRYTRPKFLGEAKT
ncbi:MAG: RnfABCDGE type electron transport complex subunit D [Proteobacteria bacterium]|nr:RnfABCDGE type electron transport complex subunit D [Pseudomonadota bacterium]